MSLNKTKQGVGVDVGGTFTDITVADENGSFSTFKILSTPDNYSRAIIDGLMQMNAASCLEPRDVNRFIHAFTVATNALLTGEGAKVGLITTKGFRDVLEIGRLRMPQLYDMDWDKPVPLVPRRLRMEVAERLDFKGNIITPLDEENVAEVVRNLQAAGVESIAVCLLHSYVNPVHEKRIVEIIQNIAPDISTSASYLVLPEIREFERTSTTVVNAFIRPVVSDYLGALEKALAEKAVRAPVMVMQSSGGIIPASSARELPAYCIESGPASGAIAAARVGRQLGIENIIAFDMGGTTAKACLIEGGIPRLAAEMEVGAGINVGSRLLSGGGYKVRVPTVDLAEIGAGGGSLAWCDSAGALHVGPRSAGSVPGPACYGLGGDRPAVTDANVVLGFLNREHLLDGEMKIHAAKAEEAIRAHVAAPLKMSVEDAAYGIHEVADATMVRAIRAVSTEQGRSPSDFTLIAFGGSGPVHAATLARQAGIRRVVVPPASGVFSALGLLLTDVEHRLVRTYWVDMKEVDLAHLKALAAELSAEGEELLSHAGFAAANVELNFALDLRYAGQSDEISIPINADALTAEGMSEAVEGFQQEHENSYGYRSHNEPVQLVAIRLLARGIDKQRVNLSSRINVRGAPSGGSRERQIYFGPQGWRTSRVIRREELSETDIPGPLVIEEYDTTTVVPPDAVVRNAANCILITLNEEAV